VAIPVSKITKNQNKKGRIGKKRSEKYNSSARKKVSRFPCDRMTFNASNWCGAWDYSTNPRHIPLSSARQILQA